MLTQLASLGAWDWFIAGGLLLVLEVLAPGAFMAWLGVAALVVGGISLYVDWTWQAQFIAFAVFSVAAVPLWQRLAVEVGAKTDQPFLNRRAEAFIGRTFTLEKPIVDGSGTIGIDDTVWRITGADIPAGSRVRVTRVDGTALHMELVRDHERVAARAGK
jgi:membrane protein implicated in regulation of membrane protease activity